MGAARRSTADSPIIATFKTRLAIAAGGTFSRKRGAHSVSHIACTSCGGPGISAMIRGLPSTTVSSHCPGAVPFAFGSTLAPCRMSACCELFSGIWMRRSAKRLYISATRLWSRFNSMPSAAATASRVRSSCVGPRPPMKIAMSARWIAVRAAEVRCSRLSPTMVLKATLMPNSLRRAVR